MGDLANIWLFMTVFCGVNLGEPARAAAWVETPTQLDMDLQVSPACYRGVDLGFPPVGSKWPGADPRYRDTDLELGDVHARVNRFPSRDLQGEHE